MPVTASGDATGTSLGAAMLFGGQAGAAKAGVLLEPLAVDGFDAYAGSWRHALSTGALQQALL
ncbi:hypothetical protein N8D56_21490 [Devosia sp. A8/3-2]|nr:hypothetical protein N8D56_21490 [Devosia sp. A8/3-2]